MIQKFNYKEENEFMTDITEILDKELLFKVVKEARKYGCGTTQITASDMGVTLCGFWVCKE